MVWPSRAPVTLHKVIVIQVCVKLEDLAVAINNTSLKVTASLLFEYKSEVRFFFLHDYHGTSYFS